MDKFTIYTSVVINYTDKLLHNTFLKDLHGSNNVLLIGDGHPNNEVTDLDFSVEAESKDNAINITRKFLEQIKENHPDVLLEIRRIQ